MPSRVPTKAVKKTTRKEMTVKEKKAFISENLLRGKLKNGVHKKKTPKHRRRGVLYIKHLPHGFYEDQLRGYFSQFGAITRLRLARSSTTLGSKGFAFIEFRYPEVAEIAADAMNNYIMFKNIIKTVYIQPKDIKHDYFRSGVKKIKQDGVKVLTSKSIEAREAVVQNHNRLMTDADIKKRTKIVAGKIGKAKKKLAALGIDYDIESVAANMDDVMTVVAKAKPTTIENLKQDDLSDDADETFDPNKFDIDSGDDFDDFEYDSAHTDDDDDINISIDTKKLENAVRIAQEARKNASIKPVTTVDTKRKQEESLEVEEEPAKKARTVRGKVKHLPEPKMPLSPVEKPVSKKKPAKKMATVEDQKLSIELEAPTKKTRAARGRDKLRPEPQMPQDPLEKHAKKFPKTTVEDKKQSIELEKPTKKAGTVRGKDKHHPEPKVPQKPVEKSAKKIPKKTIDDNKKKESLELEAPKKKGRAVKGTDKQLPEPKVLKNIVLKPASKKKPAKKA